ncbi:MAG TPA: DUF4437 domain-containing protein [Holophagaceae bacterium]|jgi:hypothetical protein|nr:DUF4437 domain-containing protein [Holophagaceae bacterium]
MNKRFWTLNAAAAAILLFQALAVAGDTATGAKARADVIMPADSIKWEDGPAKGVHIANLWGDMMKGGPYGTLVKFDAGVMHPMHWHTRTLKVVVLSGTFIHHADGGEEVKLGPGSYLLQAGGKHHSSGASADGPCEFFLTSQGKFDMHMVEDKK